MLAKPAYSPEQAMNFVKSKRFLVETKFDGDLVSLTAYPELAIHVHVHVLHPAWTHAKANLLHVHLLAVLQTACSATGERMQLHRDEGVIKWFSRNGIDHGVKSSYNVLDALIKKHLRATKCILDGELLVWNTARQG